MIQDYVRDVAVRAFHTFWQTFCAVFALAWAGTGLHVADFAHIESWHKAAAAVVAAAGAALLSTVKSLGVAAKAPADADVDTPALEDPAPAAVIGQVAVAVTPADPGQPAAGVPPSA